jgi:hypothetical protein
MLKNNTAQDQKEMEADAKEYLRAAGVARPTKSQIRAQIVAEHGKPVAKAAYQRKALGDIFGHSVASVARALGKHDWLPSDAVVAIQSVEPRASKLAIRTYVQAGRAGVRGEPAKLTSKQLKTLKAAVA